MSVLSKAFTGVEAAQLLSSAIKGKTILVTGGTLGGLGAELAATVVKHSPKLVILTARTQAKIDESFEHIRKETPNAPLRSLLLDLSSLSDVRRAAAEVNSYPETVDVLVHSAAVAGIPEHTLTNDGMELHYQTNHIGPFLLTKLLLPKMLSASKPPRILIVGSGAHAMMSSGFDYDDPNDLKPDAKYQSKYPGTKILNTLFSAALARKLGEKVETVSITPGWIASQLSRYLSLETKKKAGFIMEDGSQNPQLGSLQRGTKAYVVGAFDPEVVKTHNGGYLNSNGEVTEPAKFAQGQELEEKMWKMSEESIGEKWDL
nr:uncharacterized protein CI109_002499 [Kwoniella shandongensis]KAA5529158.1 hypothetical protein CI109_002499 [Kwoniella shandongensis]